MECELNSTEQIIIPFLDDGGFKQTNDLKHPVAMLAYNRWLDSVIRYAGDI